MTEILINADDLQHTARQFKKAGGDMLASMKSLDDAISALEGKWDGAAQQVFYRNYKDLHQAMAGLSAMMKSIATELEALSVRMLSIDSGDEGQG